MKTAPKKAPVKKISRKAAAKRPVARFKNKSLLSSVPRFSRRQLAMLASVFVVFGLFAIFLTRANSLLAFVEAEAMASPAGSVVVSDSTASGTKALKFTVNGTASGSFSLSSESDSLTLRAKGVACDGSPQAVVKVDGATIQTATVSSTGWADYAVTAKLTAGTHAFTITYPNDYNKYKKGNGRFVCTRDLFVDKVSFAGSIPAVSGSISLSGLTEGATISGPVNVEAKSTGFTLFKTEFYIDNVLYRTENSAPFCLAADNNGSYPCYNWNDPARNTQASNGPHSIKAIGYDSSGVKRAEKVVNITVSNITETTPPPPTLEGKTLVFEDNFDGTALNTNVWGTYYSPGHGGNGLRRPSAFSVTNGLLNVTATWDGTNITSGGMAHKTNYTYGTFEARVRTDADPTGQTSGVVMTWPQGDNWPYDGESDFYETGTDSDRSPFKSYIHHYRATSGSQQTVITHYASAQDWHIMRMDWTPSVINVYRDGVFIGALTDPSKIPSVPHHWSIQLDAFANGPLSGPVRMQVDWVRVYK